MKKHRSNCSSWPLKIIKEDGTEELYETYKDFISKSGRPKASKELIAYRNRRTKLKGHYKQEQWILTKHQEYIDMFFNEKTFTCDKCNQEKPIKYYDSIEEKEMKNFFKIELETKDEYKRSSVKHCTECMREWAREIINTEPLIPRTKTLQDFYNEIEQERKEKKQLKNKRYYYGSRNTNKG